MLIDRSTADPRNSQTPHTKAEAVAECEVHKGWDIPASDHSIKDRRARNHSLPHQVAKLAPEHGHSSVSQEARCNPRYSWEHQSVRAARDLRSNSVTELKCDPASEIDRVALNERTENRRNSLRDKRVPFLIQIAARYLVDA